MINHLIDPKLPDYTSCGCLIVDIPNDNLVDKYNLRGLSRVTCCDCHRVVSASLRKYMSGRC